MVPRNDVFADCPKPKVPRVSRPTRMTTMLRDRERIRKLPCRKGVRFPQVCFARVLHRHNSPGVSDGALLCNFETTMIKQNLQGLAAFKTFEYRTTQAGFQKWKLIQRDGRGGRPTITLPDNTPACSAA